jgi:hypothetical protein
MRAAGNQATAIANRPFARKHSGQIPHGNSELPISKGESIAIAGLLHS